MWEHGRTPDPMCALCTAMPGKVRVRAPGSVERGTRSVVVAVRLVPCTVRIHVETSDEVRDGDRLVPCPSCWESDRAAAALLEGAVIAVPPRRTP